jgi:hypothetical protein
MQTFMTRGRRRVTVAVVTLAVVAGLTACQPQTLNSTPTACIRLC